MLFTKIILPKKKIFVFWLFLWHHFIIHIRQRPPKIVSSINKSKSRECTPQPWHLRDEFEIVIQKVLKYSYFNYFVPTIKKRVPLCHNLSPTDACNVHRQWNRPLGYMITMELHLWTLINVGAFRIWYIFFIYCGSLACLLMYIIYFKNSNNPLAIYIFTHAPRVGGRVVIFFLFYYFLNFLACNV